MPSPPARDLRLSIRPWFLVPFARVPLPAWAIGLLISLTVAALYVAMESAYRTADPAHRVLVGTVNLVGEVTWRALYVALIPTGMCYLSLASERTNRELRPLWRNTDAELNAIRAEQPAPTRWGYRLAGLAGVLIATLFTSYLFRLPIASFLLEEWNHHRVFDYGVNLAIWTMAAQAFYLWFSTTGGSVYARVSWNLDLLDLRPLAPFERERTTVALFGIVLISLASLLMLDLIERSIMVPLGILLLCLGWIATIVILPMRGVQRLISSLKQKELERVAAAISGDRSALADSRLAAQAETLSLADLLAYRDTIASVREWPVRSPTVLRVFLLLLIPVGSWVGGALVERILGRLLD
jgi:hypothetical protein